jgi:hypothetical protein
MKNLREMTNEQIFEIAQLALANIITFDSVASLLQLKLRIEKETWNKHPDLLVIRVYVIGIPDTWCAIWEDDDENKIDITVVEDKDIADVDNTVLIVKKLMEWNYLEPLIPEFHLEERNPIREAIDQIKNDPELFRGWKDNIAMAFKDEYNRQYEFDAIDPVSPDIHKIANDAAENFLNLLCHDNKKELPEEPTQS